MTLTGHFTLNFHYYEQPLFTLESVYPRGRKACVESVYTHDQRGCADVRKRTVIRTILEIRGKTADLSWRYIIGTLTNKANISI